MGKTPEEIRKLVLKRTENHSTPESDAASDNGQSQSLGLLQKRAGESRGGRQEAETPYRNLEDRPRQGADLAATSHSYCKVIFVILLLFLLAFISLIVAIITSFMKYYLSSRFRNPRLGKTREACVFFHQRIEMGKKRTQRCMKQAKGQTDP